MDTHDICNKFTTALRSGSTHTITKNQVKTITQAQTKIVWDDVIISFAHMYHSPSPNMNEKRNTNSVVSISVYHLFVTVIVTNVTRCVCVCTRVIQ